MIELLYPRYRSAHHGSLVSLATSSVALAAIGSTHGKHVFYKLGYSIFGKALQMTKAATEDPVRSLDDDALIAVLLLGLFEVSIIPISSKSPYLLS